MSTDSLNHLVQIQPAQQQADGMRLEAARERLTAARGPRYWRSLEELTNEPGFTEMLEREFPRFVGEWTDSVSRRGFLKLMSASLALAGLSACTKQPEEAIVPYVQQPEDLIPGKPMYYATARPTNFGAQPLLAESQMFRPVKLEGNPEHPVSRGAADAQSQTSILDLYDPDRAQAVMYNGGIASRLGQIPGERTWGDFMGDLGAVMAVEQSRQGAGLRILTDTVISPTLAAQLQAVLKRYPQAKWYQYDPVNRDNARAGARMALGQYLEPQYHLDQADVIVSLDADFVSGSHFPGFVKLAGDFVRRRKLDGPENATMSRLYVVESQTSTTGGVADHRLAMRASEVEQFAAALAAAVNAGGGGAVSNAKAKKLFDAVVKDLLEARGRSVIIPGEQQSATVHALAAAMNQALGNVGKTVVYTDTVEVVPTEQVAGLKELVADMNAGRVAVLLLAGVNPVFTAPVDLGFAEAMKKAGFRAALSSHADETTRLCHWQIPLSHYLETWSDARAVDGTVTVIQPLIAPLYESKTHHEFIAALSESPGQTAYEAVRAYWQPRMKGDFESVWRSALHDGFVPETAFAPKTASAKPISASVTQPAGDLEIVFRPDPSIFDGRFINNGFLQELPRPVTKLTWDNAALMSLATYNARVSKESWRPGMSQVIEIAVDGRKVQAAVMVVPGHPDDSITLHLGYGREFTGRVGTDTGFNAYALRTSVQPDWAPATIATTGKTYRLATTQHQHLIDGKGFMGTELGPQGSSEVGNAAEERRIIRSASLDEFKKNPHFADDHPFFAGLPGVSKQEAEKLDRELTLFSENGHSSWTDDPTKASAVYQWGMAIDMNSCVGCNACIAACSAENNIAVVGKEQVYVGREMLWLRVDTYFESPAGDVSNPRAYFQPIPCMQCENAPCEPVCPVAATAHSPEGLNNMVYNRCVGTRYCSNNCPYKVRRFNFLLYSDWTTESLYPMRNPDVSVRSRGVMEKCTYCVQRINEGRIQAEKEERKIRDGEVKTACQQTCPTDAIVFGNIHDPESRVSKLKKQERNYALLAEVNTRPRTTYLANVRNTNAALEAVKPGENHEHAG